MLFRLLIICTGTLVRASEEPYVELFRSTNVVEEETEDVCLLQNNHQLLPAQGSKEGKSLHDHRERGGASGYPPSFPSPAEDMNVYAPLEPRGNIPSHEDTPPKATAERAAWLLQVIEDTFVDDIFAGPKPRDLGLGFFAGRENLDWIVLGGSILLMLIIDTVFIRPHYQSGMRFPLFVLAFWVAAGGAFNAYVYMRHGLQDALQWWNGYFLEWILSMDNLFVFHLVFKVYKTPEVLLHKALFWGIVGAIVFRVIFFMAIGSLLHLMHWFRFVFGIILIFSGIQAAREEDGDDDLEQGIVVRALRYMLSGRLLPPPGYDKAGSLLVWQKDETGTWKLCCTMLVPVIFCLEMTDILFAVDSVTAKVAQIPDQYIAYSSSIFAMFGLRALFFIVEELVSKLRLLKYGLCFILLFIGMELIFADYVQLPASVVCLVITGVFGWSVLLSVLIPLS